MEANKFSLMGIYDLCRKYYREIIGQQSSLEHVLDDRLVRFINPFGQFDYARFGDFYFGDGEVMMLITTKEEYIHYHRPDQLTNSLMMTVPVIFAGVDTEVKDAGGNKIFTYDVCEYGMYKLMVQYTSFEEPVLVADNHSVPLSWAQEHGGFRKVGDTFFDMKKEMFKCFDPWSIWRVEGYNKTGKPVFVDGLPKPNKRWNRSYLKIEDVLNEDSILAYFKSSFKVDYVTDEGECVEDYQLFCNNYPENYQGATYEMVVNDDNFEDLVYNLMIHARNNPNNCYVLCDFYDDLVIEDSNRKKYAHYFDMIKNLHMPNIMLPDWIVRQWIDEI